MEQPTTETRIMSVHFTVSLSHALVNIKLPWHLRAATVCGAFWSVLHGHCPPWGWLILVKTTAYKSRRRKRRTDVCLDLRPPQSQGTYLNPVRQVFLVARVQPSSSWLELSSVNVLTAFLTELLKGLSS